MTNTPPIRVHTALETLPIDTLVPYARNSRTHSPEQVAQIAASIREFGFTNPVLIDDAGGIIAGHGRVLGARAVGLAAVPCLRLAGLSDAQKRAYVIADNKLAMNAGWDDALLAAELQHLEAENYNLQLTGFNLAEIEASIHQGMQTLNADQLRAAEAATDTAPATEDAFQQEMAATKPTPIAPIVPFYAEHHQAFVIVCTNTIDEAWLRHRLKLDQPRQSYKDQKIREANVLTVDQLKAALA